MAKKKSINVLLVSPERAVREREKLDLNQTDFWRRMGLSQSAGSRFEHNLRKIDGPIAILFYMIYGDLEETEAAARFTCPEDFQ